MPYGGPYGHGGVAPPLLSDAYRTRAAAGQIDAKAPLGSERNPYGETQDTPIPSNAYGIGLDGSWHTPEPTQDELQAAFTASQPKPAGPKLPLRFYLEAGLMEDKPRDGVSLLTANRHLRTVLRARGNSVEYREFNGGHSILNWRGSFADGVLALFGSQGISPG